MNKAIIAAAAMAASTTAFAGAHSGGSSASGPNYTYADIGYWVGSSGAEDNDAIKLRGSFGFAEKWYVRGAYYDGENNNDDFDGYELALGGAPSITESTDLVWELGYFDRSDDNGSLSDDTDGYFIATGIRSMIADNVELNAWVRATDADSNGSDSTSIDGILGGQYYFNDNIGVGVDYEVSGDAADFYVRWNF